MSRRRCGILRRSYLMMYRGRRQGEGLTYRLSVTRGCPLLGLVSKKSITSCPASKLPPPTLRYALGDIALVERYPRHGWAKNSQEVKLLWLPICRAITGLASVAGARSFLRALALGEGVANRMMPTSPTYPSAPLSPQWYRAGQGKLITWVNLGIYPIGGLGKNTQAATYTARHEIL
jgi:hypothetical protein